ncbi:uncharacterized protein LOC118511664 [Anopheles stephensi]|uniref:uncharacterized protein LOC118511664 n=1 Tax=Anopheles stephensi TaxID=30069 RepID=UPI001658813C|nr:uncharacterized protein LOC118511664 [Anopheles stephensi]
MPRSGTVHRWMSKDNGKPLAKSPQYYRGHRNRWDECRERHSGLFGVELFQLRLVIDCCFASVTEGHTKNWSTVQCRSLQCSCSMGNGPLPSLGLLGVLSGRCPYFAGTIRPGRCSIKLMGSSMGLRTR